MEGCRDPGREGCALATAAWAVRGGLSGPPEQRPQEICGTDVWGKKQQIQKSPGPAQLGGLCE